MKRPVVYFSFRSPFSWLALRRLVAAMPTAFDELDLVPYWEPDRETAAALAARGAEIRYAAMSKAKHLYILYDTRRLAAKHGFAIKWPIDVAPHWEVPHLAWLAARRLGRGREMYEAIVHARWQGAHDICARATIARLATELGLTATLADAPDDPDLRDEGVLALTRAYEDDVFGVPYFRTRNDRFWGYDRVLDFIAALGRDTSILEAAPADSPAYDTDGPGGCG